MKQYMKILATKRSEGFEYVKTKFPKITEAKLKEGILVDLPIKEV